MTAFGRGRRAHRGAVVPGEHLSRMQSGQRHIQTSPALFDSFGSLGPAGTNALTPGSVLDAGNAFASHGHVMPHSVRLLTRCRGITAAFS